MTFDMKDAVARATEAWLAANTVGIPSSILRRNQPDHDSREPSQAERVLGRELDGDETMRRHDEAEIRNIVNFDREPL